MDQQYHITFNALAILNTNFNYKLITKIGELYHFNVSFEKSINSLPDKNSHVILIPYHKDHYNHIQNLYFKYPNIPIVLLLEHRDDIQQILSDKHLFFYLSPQDTQSLEFNYHQLWRWILELIQVKNNIDIFTHSISIAGGELSFITETYTKNNQIYNLTGKQVEILKTLLEYRGQIVLRTTLLDKIWPTEKKVVTDRVIDTNIVFLRKMFGDQGRSPKYLQTIFGQGYRLNFD